MRDSRALAEFLKANLDAIPAPKGYEEFRQRLKAMPKATDGTAIPRSPDTKPSPGTDRPA